MSLLGATKMIVDTQNNASFDALFCVKPVLCPCLIIVYILYLQQQPREAVSSHDLRLLTCPEPQVLGRTAEERRARTRACARCRQ